MNTSNKMGNDMDMDNGMGYIIHADSIQKIMEQIP